MAKAFKKKYSLSNEHKKLHLYLNINCSIKIDYQKKKKKIENYVNFIF